jgi:hypothetical protein
LPPPLPNPPAISIAERKLPRDATRIPIIVGPLQIRDSHLHLRHWRLLSRDRNISRQLFLVVAVARHPTH